MRSAKPILRLKFISGTTIILVACVIAFVSRRHWLPHVFPRQQTNQNDAHEDHVSDKPQIIKLSSQAQSNLGLTTEPAALTTYWKKTRIPGVVAERAGLTDQTVSAPFSGIISQIYATEGDLLQPGNKLVTLALLDEASQTRQAELYRATRETQLLRQEIERIGKLVETGVIPGKRLIELQQDVARQLTAIEITTEELQRRGFTSDQMAEVTRGQLVKSVDIVVPSFKQSAESAENRDQTQLYEVQTLGAELGMQIEAGENIMVLANHATLYIRGHAFKHEAQNIARAAENHWPVEIDFTEQTDILWGENPQSFEIRHLSNSIDPLTRTFDFIIPLRNQHRTYSKGGSEFVLWRFRPGERVTIEVPVEKLDDVIVLPQNAVVHEGPEAYVFTQNGNFFNRLPVHILYQDRTHAVIANDGSITLGFYLAQGSASSLNRVFKSQSASGTRPDVHVHADGTVHEAH